MITTRSRTRRRFLCELTGASVLAIGGGSKARSQPVTTGGREFVLENEVLRIGLAAADAGITVLDKRTELTWRQHVATGFSIHLDSVRSGSGALSAEVSGPSEKYSIRLAFVAGRPESFELTVAVPGRRYASFGDYPFPFAAPSQGWHYVQNTVGEGMLMPMDRMKDIVDPFSWRGGQPWWGITDLKRAMRSRRESFATVEGVHAVPLRVSYAFFAEGGYVALAKEFRRDFLAAHPDMRPLTERVAARPAVDFLRDAAYVYFWGDTPAEDLEVARQMKAAGIDRCIAVTYGRHEVDRASTAGMAQLGLVVGKYQMPTGNRFNIYKRNGYAQRLLNNKLGLDQLVDPSDPDALRRVCTKEVLKEWPAKAKTWIEDYGVKLFYFDTMAVQVAACVHPDHPETVEENTAGRLEIMKRTRDMGMVIGSGEGLSPSWALPGVDFFEGQMNLRDYHNTTMSVPSGGFAKDLGEDYAEAAATQLDATRRIPLYQLGFHDYVVGTWVWRDTNLQSTPYAWKKDLFNILYGSMPMWHISGKLWERHKKAIVASYRTIASVRRRIGFAEMTNHGWLTEDRSVQFTDWSRGDRVIVNFGDRSFDRRDKKAIAARSFVMEEQA
jgi:hypothetical protein